MGFGKRIAIGIIALVSIGLLACQDDGSMGNLGEQFDEEIEEAREELTGEKGTFESVGEKLDDAASEVRDTIKQAEAQAEDP